MSDTLIFALILCATGVGLIAWHVVVWRAAREEHADGADELDFARRQFRRRCQASGMIVLVGLSLAAEPFVPPDLAWVYVVAVLILVAWIMVLALADVIATQYHFSRFNAQERVEAARLKAELRRERDAESR